MQEQVNQLRRQIDIISSQAFALIKQGDYVEANQLLLERFGLIKQLTDLAAHDIDHAALKNYLSELYQRDQTIIQQLAQDKAALKNIVANLHKIQQYTTSF